MSDEINDREPDQQRSIHGRRYLTPGELARQMNQLGVRGKGRVAAAAPKAAASQEAVTSDREELEEKKHQTDRIDIGKLREARAKAQEESRQSEPESDTVMLPRPGLKAIRFGSTITPEAVIDLRQVAEAGDYELLDVQAKGAEAILYRARYCDYEFCVKAIRNRLDEWLGNPLTRNNTEKLQNIAYKTKCRHLLNEYQIGQRLASNAAEVPVVRILGLHKVKRFGLELGYDLLMEFISGHDLSDRQTVKYLTLEDKVKVMYRAAQALDFLHRRKIIHLDIKPSNFMLSNIDGRVRLLDFGVSVSCGYKSNTISGTIGFMSPEQICKESLNEATDIFALGVTFSLLCGGKILTQNHEEMLQKEVRRQAKDNLENTAIPAISDIPELTGLPLIADIIRNCTILKRDARISSCATLLAQLRNAAKQYGIDLD